MSKAQRSQEVSSTEQSPAEFGTSEGSPVRTKPARKDRRVNRGSGRQALLKPEKPFAEGGPPATAGAPAPGVVRCVADFTIIVCRDSERRRKRLKLAESYRECGMDEAKVAEYHVGLAEKLSHNTEAGAVGVANAKLLLEVLKDVAHALEPPKTAGVNESIDAPQMVRLIHNVPRPVRTE